MACGRQPGHGRTPQCGRRAGTDGLLVVIGSSRAGSGGPKAGIGGLRARANRSRAGIGSSRARTGRPQAGIGSSRPRSRVGRCQTGIGGLRARAVGWPGAGAGRWLADAGRAHGRAGHGIMLPRWPGEPCRTSLSPVGTAGPVILWLSDPVRGRASAGRRGISGWLCRRSRYHGSPRTGRDGGRPARGIMAKLLAREPGPVPPARLAPPHTAGCPTPGPRSRRMLTRCRGVRLNEAGRPAALIMGGSSMLGLLPRSLLFLQRTAMDDETPACLAAQSACHAGKRWDRYFDEKFHRMFRWCPGMSF
jgi:hypothetical protein